jgi:probable F420-dependent oxidoreductase
VRLGVITPVLTMLPRAHARWEESAGIAEVERVVVEAERLGYHHVTCSEHVAIPVDVADTRGARYWDPLSTFGYLAAKTRTIRLATHVLVLGYHHPLAIAKRYGTLDRVCGGRLILGVGVGSLQEEFALLGAPFDARGDIADDAMRALRASLSQSEPEYHGRHFDYEGFIVDPPAAQHNMPMWVGGRTYRSLRRAVELGDGWAPFGMTTADLAAMLTRVQSTDGWHTRDAPFDFVLQNERPLDPLAEPDVVRERLERFTEIGATMLNCRFVHHSVVHYVEQLAAMAELAGI